MIYDWIYNMDAKFFFGVLVLIPILIWTTVGYIEFYFPNRITTPIYKIIKYITCVVLLIDIIIFFYHNSIV